MKIIKNYEEQGHLVINVICETLEDYNKVMETINNEKEHPFRLVDRYYIKEKVAVEVYMNIELTTFTVTVCDCALNGDDFKFLDNLLDK